MADNVTGLPIQTLTGQKVDVNIIQGGNTAAVSAAGRLSVDASGIAVPVTDNGGSLTVDGSVAVTGSVDTELATAAALADNTANPTVTSVGTFPHWFDGTNWDRAPGTTADGLLVNLGANNDVTIAGTMATNLTQYGTVAVGAGNAIHVQPGTGAEFVAIGSVAHDAAASDAPLLTAAFASAAAPSNVSADGDVVTLWALRNGSQVVNIAAGGTLIPGDGANGLDVDVTRVTGTVTVDSELPAAALLADNTATPTVPGVGSFLMGYDGTNFDMVRVANTGRLQVDVITGGASSGALTDPKFDRVTSAALGAGAPVDLDFDDITTATTGELHGIDVASSVPLKVEVKTVTGGSGTTRVTLFAQPFVGLQWRPPHQDYIKRAGGAGNFFRATVTNLDAAVAADVYATAYWDEV